MITVKQSKCQEQKRELILIYKDIFEPNYAGEKDNYIKSIYDCVIFI